MLHSHAQLLPPFRQHQPNTPPGFLQGIRRIVAVTAQDAAAAIAKGDQLAARVGQAARLEGKPLEAELTDLKLVSWQHSCGAAHRLVHVSGALCRASMLVQGRPERRRGWEPVLQLCLLSQRAACASSQSFNAHMTFGRALSVLCKAGCLEPATAVPKCSSVQALPGWLRTASTCCATADCRAELRVLCGHR